MALVLRLYRTVYREAHFVAVGMAKFHWRAGITWAHGATTTQFVEDLLTSFIADKRNFNPDPISTTRTLYDAAAKFVQGLHSVTVWDGHDDYVIRLEDDGKPSA